ncbi:hypothetical protein OH738_18600 [Streptomyces hirsutus]|uniref:hypothetical protein n=1 Tax=Streptomyces hirsutus TaxID=35620 RepID=UPI00387048E3|nr:hypothetical protein OH738_18600 [Streptomyces hirsutus]
MNRLLFRSHLAVDAFDPNIGGGAMTILRLLAWCASAAGVAGLIIIGINMSLQLRRGDPGEGGEHFRGVFFVVLAALIATCAGPLVAFLGDLSLHAPE